MRSRDGGGAGKMREMALASFVPTDYAAHVAEVMRRLPLDKQAQVSGYVDAIEENLGDEIAPGNETRALDILDELYAEAVASGKPEDIQAGLTKRAKSAKAK